MKKILIILPAFTFGGTVFSTLNMVSMLPRDKYEITILAMTHQGPVKKLYENFGVLKENLILAATIGRMQYANTFTKKVVFTAVKVITRLCQPLKIDFNKFIYKIYAKKLYNEEQFDVVASAQEGPATYFASCFSKSKRIAWFRSEYKYYLERITQRQYKAEQSIYKLFDNIVCVSNTTAQDFVKYIRGCENKTIAIHNIQNTDSIISKSEESIDDPRFDATGFVIVSIGRIDPQKRFSCIPEIASKIIKSGNKFKWYILGEGNVMGERDKLEMNIEKYGVQDYVYLLGSKINPYPYIRSASLLVNTSYVEACPRVVMEAKILRIPVICADFSSATEFVNNGIDGFVGKISELDGIILNLISNSKYYDEIKSNANAFRMNNEYIKDQLENLFGE